MEQAQLQLSREPRPLPTMRIDPAVRSIFDFEFEHFRLENYEPHPHISAPVAVCSVEQGAERVAMRISIIVAVAENGVIGRGGKLPWHLGDDLQAIQAADDGPHDRHGSEDVGVDRPAAAGAAERRHFAAAELSRRAVREVVGSLDEALAVAEAAGDDEAFVIGGAEIYRVAIAAGGSAVSDASVRGCRGDTYFPRSFEMRATGSLSNRADHDADEKNEYAVHASKLYERRVTESDSMAVKEKLRCGWSGADELMIAYHDTEWGVPVHDDQKQFEFLTLESCTGRAELVDGAAEAREVSPGVCRV